MRAALLAALIAVSILSTAVLAQTGGSVDLEAVSVTSPGVLTAGSPVQLTAAINEKLISGKSATIPAYTVKFQYRKASSGLGGIFGRLVAQIAYPTGQQVVSPGSTPVISGADLAVTDISFADSMMQVTILNKGTETAKFTTDNIKIGLSICVSKGGQCVDNPLLTRSCTSLPGGSCTLKNPWGVTCTCNFKPFAAAKSYTLVAGQSTVVSIPNVPAPTGDSQLYATINVPSLKEVNTADNTVKIKRTADGWTDIDGYDIAAHTITKTTQRRALKSWTPPASGAWEVRVTVDSGNTVKESNEKNNVKTKQFEVQPLKPSNAPLAPGLTPSVKQTSGISCDSYENREKCEAAGCVWDVTTDICKESTKVTPGTSPKLPGTPNAVCGNGIVENNEKCDGANLNGKDCTSLGFAGGTLKCKADCSDFDKSGCKVSICGNNKREGAEACDGTDLNGMSCKNFGTMSGGVYTNFTGGTLKCKADCSDFDKSGCA
jgi:hypothetical protein